jgi:hypothetical protein
MRQNKEIKIRKPSLLPGAVHIQTVMDRALKQRSNCGEILQVRLFVCIGGGSLMRNSDS